jgi:hypothetical protein
MFYSMGAKSRVNLNRLVVISRTSQSGPSISSTTILRPLPTSRTQHSSNAGCIWIIYYALVTTNHGDWYIWTSAVEELNDILS